MKHLRPVKSLGQSFLTYEPAADRLVEALNPMPGDEVIEIGPGKGVLTRRLVGRCRRVTAIEIDQRLVEYLRNEFAAAPGLEIVHQDALGFDFTRFRDAKVIGNLPYNVASQMMFRLLEHLPSWRLGVFTLQREFALRLLAEPGIKDYGAVTVQFALDTESERLFNLPPEYFKPSPDVMSTAILMRRRAAPVISVADRAGFVRVVKAAFAQRRKTLGNNLSHGLGLSKVELAAVAERSGIELGRRAETLTTEEFGKLAAAIGHC